MILHLGQVYYRFDLLSGTLLILLPVPIASIWKAGWLTGLAFTASMFVFLIYLAPFLTMIGFLPLLPFELVLGNYHPLTQIVIKVSKHRPNPAQSCRLGSVEIHPWAGQLLHCHEEN